TPIDDSVSEWTEEVVVTVADGLGYLVSPTHGSATAEIVDDDLGLSLADDVLIVNNDDDNENGIPDHIETTFPGTEDDDLVELTLDYPRDVKAGAEVKLSASEDVAGKLRVWTADGEQILGRVRLPEGVPGPE